MATINQYEPRVVTQGETALWQRVVSDYPAPTWSLNYVLIGPNIVNVTGAANGLVHEINVNIATTVNWTAGNYAVYAQVSNGTEIFPVATLYPTIQVRSNPSAVNTFTVDQRSWARQTLEVVETALKTLAAKTVSSASVNGTTYTLQDMDQLLKLRSRCLTEIANEDAQANPSRHIVYTRFTKPI